MTELLLKKAKTKEEMFAFLIDILDFDKDWDFKKDNDIVDAIGMAICYIDDVLNFRKLKQETDYGFLYLNNW